MILVIILCDIYITLFIIVCYAYNIIDYFVYVNNITDYCLLYIYITLLIIVCYVYNIIDYCLFMYIIL